MTLDDITTDLTTNDLINKRLEVRAELAALSSEEKRLKEIQDSLDKLIMKKLDDQGITKSANDSASVSISEQVVPQVEDWDAFQAHILSTGDFALLQRRASSTAYRELRDSGVQVPGVIDYTKRSLNVRAS